MAVRPNQAASDRHLKKIYDCLNIGSNKKAVQEVDRLPKNVRDLTVFKALKSLALIRLCKRQQAFDILSEINPDDDLDEVTLTTMTSCYKESVEVSRIVGLYEAAARRKPLDPEVMAHLFMAYVRVFNFKKQKEIAMQMYKNFPKKKRLYSFWAIMSLVMQSQDPPLDQLTSESENDNHDKKVCLTLAEKMCEKMIDEERTSEEIELYLLILRKQNKHEEEYRFLTGPICLRITDHLSWFNRRRAYLCLDLKMYSRAFKHYFPTLIQEYPDQVEYYQGLFKSAFLLDTEAPSQQQPVAISDQQVQQATSQSSGTPVKSNSALAECYDIVEKQCLLTIDSTDSLSKDQLRTRGQTGKNLSRTSSLNPHRKKLLRGPFMARIELFNTIHKNEGLLPDNVFKICKNQMINRFPTLNSLLLDYFQSFSRKIICYYDMELMIEQYQMKESEKEELVVELGNWVKSQEANPDVAPYDFFHIQLNHNLLKHCITNYKTIDKERRYNLARNFIDLYDRNRALGKVTNKTEFQPVDTYCLLAIHSILTDALDLYNSGISATISDSTLLSLIVMAETAISNSPSNHQLKLTLLKLYSLIGASKQCSEVLLSLDIKHFQIDTLGHLLNPVLYNTGNYTLSRDSLETCLEFYSHGVRECFEGLTTSYRDGRFSKIEEISNVLKRLSDSLNATQCVLLCGIVANLTASNPEELFSASRLFDPFKSLHRIFRCPQSVSTIRDNRDLKVLKSFNSEINKLVQQRQTETLVDEKLWLNLRYCILRSSYIQLEYFNDHELKKEDKFDHVTELNLRWETVKDLLPRIDEIIAKSQEDRRFSFFEPEASQFRWKHVDHHLLVSLVNPIVFLSDVSKLDTSIQEEYNSNLERLVSVLEDQLSSIGSLVQLKQALQSLTMTLEFISVCATSLVSLSGNAAQIIPQVSHPVGRNSSSQSHAAVNPSIGSALKSKPIVQQMINKTEAQLTRLSNLIRSVDPKSQVLDKIQSIDGALLSGRDQSRIETKAGSVLAPLMASDSALAMFVKVKERLLESFNESFREIETTCRKKTRLFRFKEV